MRHVQKLVKDVSKTISHSPLYHHALGTKMPELPMHSNHSSLAPPFSAGLNPAYAPPLPPPTSAGVGAQNPYVMSGLATPLSVAIGPAAAHTVASTPSAITQQREYYAEPLTSRPVHERNDTVMQQPPVRQQRRQM